MFEVKSDITGGMASYLISHTEGASLPNSHLASMSGPMSEIPPLRSSCIVFTSQTTNYRLTTIKSLNKPKENKNCESVKLTREQIGRSKDMKLSGVQGLVGLCVQMSQPPNGL